MRHRGWLLALVLLVALDFAVPFEPVRGGFVLDDDEEEAVSVETWSAERPTATVRRDAPAPSAAARRVTAVARVVTRAAVTPPPRALVATAAQPADPASATDDH